MLWGVPVFSLLPTLHWAQADLSFTLLWFLVVFSAPSILSLSCASMVGCRVLSWWLRHCRDRLHSPRRPSWSTMLPSNLPLLLKHFSDTTISKHRPQNKGRV